MNNNQQANLPDDDPHGQNIHPDDITSLGGGTSDADNQQTPTSRHSHLPNGQVTAFGSRAGVTRQPCLACRVDASDRGYTWQTPPEPGACQQCGARRTTGPLPPPFQPLNSGGQGSHNNVHPMGSDGPQPRVPRETQTYIENARGQPLNDWQRAHLGMMQAQIAAGLQGTYEEISAQRASGRSELHWDVNEIDGQQHRRRG